MKIIKKITYEVKKMQQVMKTGCCIRSNSKPLHQTKIPSPPPETTSKHNSEINFSN
jgi:hypothetical protein